MKIQSGYFAELVIILEITFYSLSKVKNRIFFIFFLFKKAFPDWQNEPLNLHLT